MTARPSPSSSPASVQVSHLADYLVQPAAFSASDADGKVWLTNEDLKQVTSTKGSKDGTGCVVLTLTTRGRQSLKEATAAIADRDSDKKLYIKMDGQTIASPTISSKIDSSSVNIENNFTEQVAENYALLLNAGVLPGSRSPFRALRRQATRRLTAMEIRTVPATPVTAAPRPRPLRPTPNLRT